MKKNVKVNLLKTTLLACALVGTGIAHADDDDDVLTNGVIPQCEYSQLVNSLIGQTDNQVTNQVCVDVPVGLKKAKVVFNLDSTTTANGKEAGPSIGLRHMWMLGNAIKDRIAKGLIDPKQVSIIGVFHGSAAAWALNDTKIATVTNGLTATPLFPAGNPQKAWIERIFALKNAGVNLQLEVCGVTMYGNGWTNADLYTSPNGQIHVNQGAIGRVIYLEQHGYQYIQEGWADADQN